MDKICKSRIKREKIPTIASAGDSQMDVSIMPGNYLYDWQVGKAIEAYINEEDSVWIYNSTYNGDDSVTGNANEVEQPNYLSVSSLNDGNDHWVDGIPYCWGGDDFPSEFQAKIDNRPPDTLYFAGNVCPDSDYQVSGTTGADCSGFVCNCFDMTHITTSDMLNNSNFSYIGNWEQGSTYDILLKSGHVMILNSYTTVNGQKKRMLCLGINN